MLRVECIDNFNTTVLEIGKVYYAFPTPGGKAAYISRFPNKNSHFGCFQLSRFIKTEKPVSTFYVTNSTPKVRQNLLNEFKKSCYYLARMKGIADHYNPYFYVYAVSEEKLAIFDGETFRHCLGTSKSILFEKISECEVPKNPGRINLFPVAITYGMLMERENNSSIVNGKLMEIKEKEDPACESKSDSKYEQLSLF